MFHFLHTFNPEPLLFSWNFINIHWYGLCIALGSVLSLVAFLYLAKNYGLTGDQAIDLYFYLMIFGLVGARFYSVLLDLPFYLEQPSAILKFWRGGLAIHGAIVFGVLTLMYLAKKNGWNFWRITSLVATVIPLGQAIGRWGNYFNQELFGRPTSLPFGIPINLNNRPLQYISSNFFHPVFLYESLGDLLIFLILFVWQLLLIKKKKVGVFQSFFITWTYLGLYSLLRFWTESLRVDEMPVWHGWRWSQLVSLVVLVFSVLIMIWFFVKTKISAKAVDRIDS